MTLDTDLTGRVAVITGASSGIGESTARSLAARGASVALLARRADKLETIAEDIRTNGGTALVVALDVTDAAAVEEAAATVAGELGTANIVFANAGIMLPAAAEELRTDQWRHQIDLNIQGLMNTIGSFLSQLTDNAAAGEPADLISTSSIAAHNLFTNFAVYSASKAYVTHLTTHLRAELGPKGVRVADIAPGIVGTELQSHVTDQGANDWLEGSKDTIEWLTGDDVAEVVTFMVGLPKHVNLQEVKIMPTAQTA